MVGGGGGDRGKCTIEVVVDGIAEVEIRGDQGSIQNIAGQPAQWRRFQCSAPLPRNPGEFRFQGIDGRGRQNLVRDPRNGGVAVVRIEDPRAAPKATPSTSFGAAATTPAADPTAIPPTADPAPTTPDPAATIALRTATAVPIVRPAASPPSRPSTSVRIRSAGKPSTASVGVEWNS